MLFFGDISNKQLSSELAEKLGSELIFPDVHVFPDSEKRIRVLQDVVDQKIIVLKSLSDPVDSNLLEFVFLIDALKRSGAGEVTAIIPYLAYQRADHIFRDGEAVPLEVVIKMIEDSGVDKVISLDLHSIRIPELFHIPFVHASALQLFANTIRTLDFHPELCVVSPDAGGVRRTQQLAEYLGGVSTITITKDRDLETGKVVTSHHEGEIKKVAVIIDDICSTGQTLVNAADYLLKNGVEKVYACVTHPVLSANASELIQNSQIEKIYMTNSIPVSADQQFKKLKILSVAQLLASDLKSQT
jgi:ribose-phosphate pyrophosphokinase